MTKEQYLEREPFLTTVPLAKSGGLTQWVLVDKTQPVDKRRLLASCETIYKPSLISDSGGNVVEVACHGIGSVFCDPAYRGRGYAGRMMSELAKKLRTWQDTDERKIAFSVLWSDIGAEYYATHGWQPFPSTHIEFTPSAGTTISMATTLKSQDLDELCRTDELSIRKAMKEPSSSKTRVAIIPNADHMAWHHLREDFICTKIFGKAPHIKGAIAGRPGQRVWAIWTRSYGGSIASSAHNTLHILRFVIEDDTAASTVSLQAPDTAADQKSLDDMAAKVEAVLQIARKEAAEWKLSHVELWNPTALVLELVGRIEGDHKTVDRALFDSDQSIPALLWFGDGKGGVEELEWIGNEKYGWC